MTKREVKRKYEYRLMFLPSALSEWQALDTSVRETFRKILRKRLDNPHVPGAALHGDLIGHYKIKLKARGYRLVYSVEDVALVVLVIAAGKRAGSVVYLSAAKAIRRTEGGATHIPGIYR